MATQATAAQAISPITPSPGTFKQDSASAGDGGNNTLDNAPTSNIGNGVRSKTDMGYPGEGPWHYTLLREPFLSRELERMSAPRVYAFDGAASATASTGGGGGTGGEGGEGAVASSSGTDRRDRSASASAPVLPPRKAYSVSLQPCLNPDQASQDRIVVENWTMPDGEWVFTGVFDGTHHIHVYASVSFFLFVDCICELIRKL